jgi:septum formation protein
MNAFSTLIALPAPLVLASASPRRRTLLEQLGLNFRVVVSDFDETTVPTDLAPEDYVQELAREKALQVAQTLSEPAIVLAADTTVVLGSTILNKPMDVPDAARMLRLLSNRTHDVFTGIAIVETSTGRMTQDFRRTEVRFRELSEAEIAAYIRSGAPMDKAGAYGIQDDFGAVFISEIHGCYYNVVGLPLELVYRRLKEFC